MVINLICVVFPRQPRRGEVLCLQTNRLLSRGLTLLVTRHIIYGRDTITPVCLQT